MIRKQDVFPLAALAALALVTGLWWAFALWPLPETAPPWLERARYVCFNTGGTGLPERSGWILLIGQPLGMLALLMAGWRERTREAVSHLWSSRGGRTLAGLAGAVAVGGLAMAGARVLAAATPPVALPVVADVPDTYPRLDLPWPGGEGLVDQHGAPFTLASLDGRPALVTFAYAHCETVCPLLVRAAQEARQRLVGEVEVTVVALTLDPWRDTPARLPDMARGWGFGTGDFVVGGAVAAVQTALDRWNVPRERDERTGELSHPALTFLVDSDGTVAFATTGAPDQIVALARRLR